MDAKQVFRNRLAITAIILVAWFTIPFAGVISLTLTLIAIGAMIGTFVRVRPERQPKNIRWFVVIAVGAIVSYLIGTLIAAAAAAAAVTEKIEPSILAVTTSALLLLTALFFTARIGIEGYLSWAARKPKK